MADSKKTGPMARVVAAEKWATENDPHGTFLPIPTTKSNITRLRLVLAGILFSPEALKWLAENDPSALARAQQAISNTDYTQYI